MTRTRPRRLITLHLSHMGLTLGLTFMSRFLSLVLYPLLNRADLVLVASDAPESETQHISTLGTTNPSSSLLPANKVPEQKSFCHHRASLGLVGSLVPVGDPAPRQIVRSYLHLNSVPREDANAVHPHLARAVREYLVTVLQLHPEHGIGQWLDHLPFQDYRVFTWFSQVTLLSSLLVPASAFWLPSLSARAPGPWPTMPQDLRARQKPDRPKDRSSGAHGEPQRL